MTYNLKKDYVKTWNLQQTNEKTIMNIENDDDQDIYISERSSLASLNDLNQTLTSFDKQSATPTKSTVLLIPQKQPQILRYSHNELPENGIPIPTQYQHPSKEEKKKEKDLRKVPPVHGTVIPLSETKSSEYSENHYPYWCHYKAKNSNSTMRHGQNTSYDAPDPSQYAHQPALTTSPIKPQQPSRKSRHPHIPNNHLNQDKQRLDHLENNLTLSTHLTTHENHESNHQKRRSSPKPYIPFKDTDHDEHRLQPIKQTIPQQRRKLKIENDWPENHMQSISNSRPSQDSNSLIITSNSLANCRKNRSKVSDKSSLVTDMDESVKSRHPPHYYHPPHHYQNQNQSHNTSSIPHHNHLHVRRRPPSGSYLASDVHVVDVSFKKPDRTSYIQQTRDPFHSPRSTISNQTSHLPLIIRDHHHQQKTHSPRFPTEYYGTLARQTYDKSWDEPLDIPKIYKTNPQTRFYDRYLHNVVDKRLAA